MVKYGGYCDKQGYGFVKYINDKANSKKVNLQIYKLKYNYPILTTI